MRRRACLAVAVAVALAACARNPVTGKPQFTLVSKAQEIELGKQAAEQVKQSIPPVDDRRLQDYVASIGMKMARASERPDLPWSFTVIDDPSVNAFALPGGPIFVTRGILTHLTSEAELAGVLGHEIGHVTARHSVSQISKAQLAQLGLGIGTILAPDLAGAAQAAAVGLQLLFLKYGRDAESQADALGFRYMLHQDYDPRQMVELFKTLEKASAQEGGGRLPEWLSTHPDPQNREKVAAERASKLKIPRDRLEVDRERYLAAVDGLVFGEDPRQGYFRGDTFIHPTLRFQLQLPRGWKAQNAPSAVVAVSPEKDAAVQLSAAGKLSPEEATRRFFSQQGVRALRSERGRTEDGLPATESAFEARTQQGVLQGIVSFVEYGGATYMLVGYAPAERLAARAGDIRRTLSSFGPVTDRAALTVSPARVRVVTLPDDMTLPEFAQRWPSSVPLETLALVNGVEKGARLRAGDRVKQIVGGAPLARR